MFTTKSSQPKVKPRQFENIGIQPKLKIGKPDDKFEQEANRMADAVVRMPDPQVQMQSSLEEEEERLQMQPKQQVPELQRMYPRRRERSLQGRPLNCLGCEKKLQMTPAIQRQDDGQTYASPEISNQIHTSKGHGAPLSSRVQQEMAHKIGSDFSGVNIHTDSKSHQLNQQLGARAFTHGNDIYFNKGEYNPKSHNGKRLLAHELTHVAQQRFKKSIYRQQQPDEEQTDNASKQQSGKGQKSGGNSAIVSVAKSRSEGDIGKAYNWSPGWFYTPNSNLAGARKEPLDWEKNQGASKKDGEWIVNWGTTPTCNVYVYDVLYQAGLNPPLLGNNHYYDAPMSHEGADGYLKRINNRSQIQPGDIFTNGVHMEIITAVKNNGKSFNSAGAHKNDTRIDKPSRYAKSRGLKFWRVQ
jgi:hypothetical protein